MASVSNDFNSKSWQQMKYGGVEELRLVIDQPVSIKTPDQVLIQARAASVNPIDPLMMEGFGRRLLNIVRLLQGIPEFPLTVGRDFSGTVVQVGKKVTKYKIGDEVWGATVPIGTFATYICVSEKEISKKPSNLTHTEAASLPYVVATLMAGFEAAGVVETEARGKRILFTGGSGGIGTFAIQLAKTWGMHITTTCSTDAVEMCKALGADVVIDYRNWNVHQELEKSAKFDYIVNGLEQDTNTSYLPYLVPRNNSKFLFLNFPLLKNTDDLGLVFGLFKSTFQFLLLIFQGLVYWSTLRWALFRPSGKVMENLRLLVESEQIKPVIQEVFPFSELPAALTKYNCGHARGKIVLEFPSD